MIVGAAWSSTLYGNLVAQGLNGSHLQKFCDAVGLGSAGHVVGKTFATVDVGTVPGAGVGSGVGVVAIVGASISSKIYGYSVAAFGQAGTYLQKVCDAIGQTCVSQMALATLTSSHAPVFAGAGTITPGSISVVPSGWGGLINSQGSGLGFVGTFWPQFADAIGKGQGEEVMAVGTGVVAIAGSPTGLPVPGGGSGTGVIS